VRLNLRRKAILLAKVQDEAGMVYTYIPPQKHWASRAMKCMSNCTVAKQNILPSLITQR
jgi:hypothetical protein